MNIILKALEPLPLFSTIKFLLWLDEKSDTRLYYPNWDDDLDYVLEFLHSRKK